LFIDLRFKGLSGVVSCDVHNSKLEYVKKTGIFMDIQRGVETMNFLMRLKLRV
jgi:hypothetical protein